MTENENERLSLKYYEHNDLDHDMLCPKHDGKHILQAKCINITCLDCGVAKVKLRQEFNTSENAKEITWERYE